VIGRRLRKAVLVSLLAAGASGLPAREADARPARHGFALPDAAMWHPTAFVAPCVAPGEAPGAAHIDGTVFIAQGPAGGPHATVTEWDLATGSPIRSIETPIPSTAYSLRMVRAAEWLHLVAADAPGGNLEYVRLTLALHIEEAVTFAKGYGPRIATDGSLVAIAWSEVLDATGEHQRWMLATRSSSGALRSVAVLVQDIGPSIENSMVQPIAVLGGKIFAAVLDGPRNWDFEEFLLRLDADGHVEKRKRLFWHPLATSLWALEDHFVRFDLCAGSGWSTELQARDDEHMRNPYEAKTSCPSFAVAADAAGRLVTGRGDVLSSTMKVQYHFADAGPDVQLAVPAWNGETPLLVTVTKKGASRVDWAEPVRNRTPQ
jgi:hypothetical protein